METKPDRRRILIVANETSAGSEVLELVPRNGDGREVEVLVVAPALTERLAYWMSDVDAGIKAAGERLDSALSRCAAAGINAHGALGDADPLLALDDAMRTFAPDEVIIATNPEGESNWLERGLVVQARERFDVPITHVVVRPDRDDVRVVERTREDRSAPARERHATRDLTVLAVVGVLAIVGSLASFVFYAVDAPDWVIIPWVVVFDLGFKIAAAVVLWVLFQRRPRADRLDL